MATMLVEMPKEMIAERHRLGLDRRDEVWDGVYHVVPPASEEHQRIGVELVGVLLPVAKAAGLHLRYETGVFDPSAPPQRDYCVPDLVAFEEERRIPAGVDGRPALVIEIRSPDDDTLRKIPYYARVGARELVIIERDTKDVRRWVPDGASLAEHPAEADGWHPLAALPARLRGTDGHLEVATPAGALVI